MTDDAGNEVSEEEALQAKEPRMKTGKVSHFIFENRVSFLTDIS